MGKAIAKTTGQKKSSQIVVDMKINILHTISNAIYATTSGKVREAVANSMDNNASWVIISLDQTNRRMSIFDNGTGISKETFIKIFKSIGYGFRGEEESGKISYFGLGLMSVFKLGNKVKLFTKSTDGFYRVEIDSGKIFDEAYRNLSINALNDFIGTILPTTEHDRENESLDIINSIFSKGKPFKLPTTFTEIIIENIDKTEIDKMGNKEFHEELEKWLPLRPLMSDLETEPFLDRFSTRKRKELNDMLLNKTYTKTIDVYYGIQENLDKPEKIKQLWKYFPKFNSQIKFPDNYVHIGVSPDKRFAYYVVYTVGEDLERDGDTEYGESGFWFRNNNFLVRSADWLDKPGPGRKPAGTIDKPLRKWVFGEVFHVDMNRFLTVSRNGFLYDKDAFSEFRDTFLLEVASPINKAIRKIWDRRKIVLDEFISPFIKITEADGPIIKTEENLREVLGGLETTEFYSKAKEILNRQRSVDLEKESVRVDKILEKRKEPLMVFEDEGTQVNILPSSLRIAGMHEVKYDIDSNKVIVNVSSLLFSEKQCNFLGENYKIFFVACKDSDTAVSFNIEEKQIFINPFNSQLLQFSRLLTN